MVNKVCALFLDQLNRSGGAVLRSSQLKGCVSQCGFSIALVCIELEDIDVVGVNLALVRVGGAGAIATGVIAVFQINFVGCRVSTRSIFVDVSLVGHNDFVTSGDRSVLFFINLFQVVKGNGENFLCCVKFYLISVFASIDVFACNRHLNRVLNKIQALSHSINELKGILRVVAHVGDFGSKLESYLFANLCGGVILIGVTIIGRNLFIHSREGALNLNRSVSAVSGDIHKDSISTTAIVTGRTALREHQIVTSRQVIESSCALGFIFTSILCSSLNSHQRRFGRKSGAVFACPILCFVSKFN